MSSLHHPLTLALGRAVLHFLWQGALLGLLGALLLHHTASRRPELRYTLAWGLLLTMVLFFVGTVVWALPVDQGAQTVALQPETVEAIVLSPRLVSIPAGLPQAWLPVLMPWVGGAWVMGAVVMGFRILSGLAWLQVAVAGFAEPAPAEWQSHLDTLCHKLGLRLRVGLKVTRRLNTPVMLGFLRPVVLMPVAALTNLDPAHLELILVHELAHVRRFDYLANLLQTLAEALLFFHPAVWWLSRKIRQEREHCCDDVAVRHCGDALPYASALAALEAFRNLAPLHSHLAPAAKGGHLMFRIRRLLVPSTPSLLGGTPFVGLLAALACGGFTVVYARSQNQPSPAPIHPNAAVQPATLAVAPPETARQPVIHLTPSSIPGTSSTAKGQFTVTASKRASAVVEIIGAVSNPPEPAPLDVGPLGEEEGQALMAFIKDVPHATFTIQKKPAPIPYPAEALSARAHGTVPVAIIVGKDGRPRSARALTGPALLKPHAERYAMDWEFSAPTKNGTPCEGGFLLYLPFKLVASK